MAADMAVDGDPLDRLRAFQAARAAAPPDAYDVIARFGQRQLTDAVSRAPPLPVLMDKASPWLGALACDTQLYRDASFCLTPLLAAAPQPPPDMKPFDLSALQAAFTFRPSVVELTEAEKGAPLEPPPPPPPPPLSAAEEAERERKERERKERKKEKKEKKREREGDATAVTGGTSGGDASEGDKHAPKPSTSPAPPPAKAARPTPPAERKPKEPKAERERDRDRDREKDRHRDRDRDRDRGKDRDRERERERERKPAKQARARSPAEPAYAAPAQVVPLAACIPKGYAVEPVAPPLTAALIGRRVAMKGVGDRGESWCWGVIKQFYKPPTEEGWNFEVAWGGGYKELRDCRLHPDFYSTDPAEHPDMSEAWVLLEKL